MVSSDVKSLFTNVPLEYTIDLVLERIYYNGELSAARKMYISHLMMTMMILRVSI